MTRKTNARVAGVTLLLYIAVGVTQMIIGRNVVRTQGTAAMLASMIEHTNAVQANALLGLVTTFVAIALGVALYGLTREQDHELATLALLCRASEGLLGALTTVASLALLWLAAEVPSASASASITVAADLMVKLRELLPLLSATFFAVGSTIFSCLLLRGRLIPRTLAALGVIASALLTMLLPVQLSGNLAGPVTQYMWAPMAVFELGLAAWLLVKGAEPTTRGAAEA